MVKKKPKWRRVLWISLTVLVCVGGYIAAELAVDYALKQISSGVDAGKPKPEVAVKEPAMETSPPPATEPEKEKEEAPQKEEPESNEGTVSSSKPAPVTQEETKQISEEKTEPAVKSPAEEPYRADVSDEHVAEVQEKISVGEKATVVSVLLKHFSVRELKEFAEIAADGITTEEKKAARDDFLNRLGEEEYNRLIEIAAKYGLSQGKKYEEVKKE